MNNQTIVCCVVALVLGMLLANMLKNVCGCKLTEGMLACHDECCKKDVSGCSNLQHAGRCYDDACPSSTNNSSR